MPEALFLLCLAGAALVVAGYPLAVLLLGRFWPRPWRAGGPGPASVSIITVVRGTPELVTQSLKDFDALAHPGVRLELILYQDGDDPDFAAAARDHPGVRLGRTGRHAGKALALNEAVALASGEVLLFKDADAVYPPDTLTALLAPLADPAVGGVCGRRVIDEAGHCLGVGQTGYIGLNCAVKAAESAIGSITGNDGKISAIRRECFDAVPDGVTDDLYIGLGVVIRGLRLVFAPDARALIPAPSRDPAHEIERRRRIVSTSLRGLFLRRAALSPGRIGWYAVGLAINKIGRRLLPVFALGLGFSAAALAGQGPLYQAVLLGTVSAVCLALAAPLALADRLPRRLDRASHTLWYALLGNAGTLLGLVDFLRGRRIVAWTPRKSD